MRRKINGEAYLIIKKNYTLIIRNSNSDPKITLLIEPTTITTYKFSFFLLRLSKHNFYPDQSSVSQRLLSSQKLLNRTISKSLFPTKTPYQMIIYKPCSLHMSITDRRAKKLKPSFLQRIIIETAKFLLNRDETSGIRDRGCNLQPIPDNPIEKHQPVNIIRGHRSYFLNIKIIKCFFIPFTLTKNSNPSQSSLGTFQNKKFE